MLIPLNLNYADDTALSIIRTPDGYSLLPYNIVNRYGLTELSSYYAK